MELRITAKFKCMPGHSCQNTRTLLDRPCPLPAWHLWNLAAAQVADKGSPARNPLTLPKVFDGLEGVSVGGFTDDYFERRGPSVQPPHPWMSRFGASDLLRNGRITFLFGAYGNFAGFPEIASTGLLDRSTCRQARLTARSWTNHLYEAFFAGCAAGMLILPSCFCLSCLREHSEAYR